MELSVHKGISAHVLVKVAQEGQENDQRSKTLRKFNKKIKSKNINIVKVARKRSTKYSSKAGTIKLAH